MMDEKKFRHAEDALRFAFHYSGQSYDRPIMNKLADKPVRTFGETMGLSGLDGAGQAAMIWLQLMKLTDLQQFVLFACYSLRAVPCHCGNVCCSGWRPNPFWIACVTKIEEAAATAALSGCLSHRLLRKSIVRRCVGDKQVSLKSIAVRCGVDQDTAGNQHQRVKQWLIGTRNDGWTSGVKPRALARLEELLIGADLLESTQEIA